MRPPPRLPLPGLSRAADQRAGDPTASKVGYTCIGHGSHRRHLIGSGTARGAGRRFVRSDAFEVLARGLRCARSDLRARGPARVHGRGQRRREADRSARGDRDGRKPAFRRARARPAGDRARRVRDLASLQGRPRSRAGRHRQHVGADRWTGRGLVYGGLCVATIRVLTGSSADGPASTSDRTTASVFDWPGRPLARRRRRDRPARRCRIPVREGGSADVPRRDQDRGDVGGDADVDHLHRHSRPHCACGRVRAGQMVPPQGGIRVRRERGCRPRRCPCHDPRGRLRARSSASSPRD